MIAPNIPTMAPMVSNHDGFFTATIIAEKDVHVYVYVLVQHILHVHDKARSNCPVKYNAQLPKLSTIGPILTQSNE